MTTAETVRIAFDDTGQGDPPVVLVHGLFENRTYYAELVRHLGARHRVVNVDLRGHGESERPPHGYTLDALADDVARVCDEASLEKAVFCGHSIAVALRVATRRPDLAAGVVLLDGAVLHLPPALALNRQLAEAMDTEGWREALLSFFSRVAGPALDRVRKDVNAAPRAYAGPLLREIVQSAGPIQERELAQLSCPLLYVRGAFPIDLERLRRVQPDAIVEEIPGAGHYLMLSAAPRVGSAINRFLEVIG